ncbi:LysM peptidoglycan-binding domain-containing protein [Clostridium cellulovorans]|uniref:Peptidoglycan-binding lysin domain n=1 Tax=Clostridium cellulovorans (strain ATCC 35296 / DSM 3052 / OCM 3 / 743B) TaxID=573061 RepID=D9SSN5_CLOC7|nr:LysM peptidoglycan-binding domain-containing protein [Clostridium cellulovorans]ADL50632.1 Peptidoglycan-binding lysin domain [Clostridium cellulovorans 743B]
MFYIVQPDDYLNLIAWKLDVSVNQLLQFNPMVDNSPLYVGQRLFIPLPSFRAIVTYTVITGDTLDSIAKKFNATKQLIMELNYITTEVSPGQIIKIPTKL